MSRYMCNLSIDIAQGGLPPTNMEHSPGCCSVYARGLNEILLPSEWVETIRFKQGIWDICGAHSQILS
jgi:hypothetical protein